MKDVKGLSLIEILVALIIVSIIAACVSAAVVGGYYMLKQAEHKSRAMSISHVKLQEYLAKSFDELSVAPNASGDDAIISEQFDDTKDNTCFNWEVNITEAFAGGINVPYKNIVVNTLYTEKNARNEPGVSRSVRLSNIVSYPLVHIASNKANIPNNEKEYAPRTNVKYDDAGFVENWGAIVADGVLKFNYKVPKDIVVMYNLAIFYDTDHPPDVGDTVLTRCVLDNNPKEYGIITRTPIMSQVFINNIVEIPNVPAGSHTINVQWCQESRLTKVWLRSYDVTALAVEHK